MKLLSWLHPPGTAPGTLAEAADPAAPTDATLFTYTVGSLDERSLASASELEEEVPGVCRWVHIQGRDVGLVADLGDRLGVHPLILEDVVNIGQRPKIEEYDDCVFLVVDLVDRPEGSDRLRKEQVSIVLMEGLVLSFLERSGTTFDPVAKRLRGGKGRIRSAGSAYLTYALVDAVVDHFFPLLETVGAEMEEVEQSLAGKPGPEDLAALHRLRRDLLLLRRSVWPLREMMTRIMRSEESLLGEEIKVFFRDVGDHLDLIGGMIETYLEMVMSLQDLYLSTISHQMNDIMKVLTIMASIFIPLSFIAGLYGMNFSSEASPWDMPELGWYWGYPAVLGLMAAVAIGLLVVFRRRKWI